jgi:uncharacterized membrane protein YidH (DUF202 family)
MPPLRPLIEYSDCSTTGSPLAWARTSGLTSVTVRLETLATSTRSMSSSVPTRSDLPAVMPVALATTIVVAPAAAAAVIVVDAPADLSRT